MSNALKGNIAAFIAMILWSTGFPVAAAILETWHPLLLAPFRLAISAVILLGLLVLASGFRYLRDVDWWDVAWIGGGLLSASTILLLYGQDLAHPITVAVIISMMPLISAIMGWIGGTERLTLPIGIGIVLSIIGGSITSYGPSSGGDGEGSLIGAILVFTSICLFVAYSRCGGARLNKLPDTATAGLTSLAAMIVVGDISFAAVGWNQIELEYDFSPGTLALIFWMGGMAVGVAMALWFASIRLIGVTFTTMHHNLVPFYVILLSLWWSGGAVLEHHWIGAGFVIVGAAVAQLSSRRRAEVEQPDTAHNPMSNDRLSQLNPVSAQRRRPIVVSPTVSVIAPPPLDLQRNKGRDIETGMIIMACAMLILPAIDTFAKLLSQTVQAGQVSWSRFAFQTLLLAPLAFARIRTWDLSQLPIHAARGFLIALATLLFFAALKVLPVADAISIFFIEPLVLTLLSAVLLGETVGWRRLLAVAIGFVGAMIVIQPSFDVFGVRALLPLGTAVAFALYLILTRKVAQREDPITTQFMAGVFGLIIMTIALWAGATLNIPVLTPVWPTPYELLLLAGVGIVATIGHLMVVHAFRRAEAGILAPFQYLEIIPSVILGFLVFGDFPDVVTWCGIAIIVGSGLYVFYRERAVARRDAEEAEWHAQTMHPPAPTLPSLHTQSRPSYPMPPPHPHLPRPAE